MQIGAQTYVQATVLYGSDMKSPMLNVLWFVSQGLIGFDDLQQNADSFASVLNAGVANKIKSVLTTECRYLGIQVRLVSATLDVTSSSTIGAGPGNVVGDTLPDYCAVVMQKRSVFPGRSGRGRWYVGCVPEALTDTSRLTPDAWEAYEELRLAYMDQYTTGQGQWKPHTYSPKNSAVYELKTGVTQLVLGTQLNRKFRAVI